MSRSQDWMDQAACRGADPALFFPKGDNPRYVAARRLCAACPVRVRCVEFAESFEQGACAAEGRRAGMWGGLTPRGREQRARRAGSGGVLAARKARVLELHEQGLSAKEIAERLSVHERTVMRITKPIRDRQRAVAA
jgi:WhiB family redox-sensing transcriptional regulator